MPQEFFAEFVVMHQFPPQLAEETLSNRMSSNSYYFVRGGCTDRSGALCNFHPQKSHNRSAVVHSPKPYCAVCGRRANHQVQYSWDRMLHLVIERALI